MTSQDTIIGIFIDEKCAGEALKHLVANGFDNKELSIVGKGFDGDERVAGFYNDADRIVFWGNRGAFWGGLWRSHHGGVFLTLPIIGQVVIIGYLAQAVVLAIENALVIGGFSALGAALFSLGLKRSSVLECEATLKADGFLVVVHGSNMTMRRAEDVLAALNPIQLEIHENILASKAG